jgi:predicted adenylyl cyclase CyaB
MKRNIEIKALAKEFQTQLEIAKNISTTSPQILIQEDTFFNVPQGKLKLRKFSEDYGELISYSRPEQKKAKQSSYEICPTETPDLLKKTLALNLAILGRVKKKRHLYFYNQTRIHFDEVEKLGFFIEFEYVLEKNEPIEKGKEMVKFLQNKLLIRDQDLISVAYIDLLLSRT